MTRTRVKICGITRPEDAVAAVEAGADAIGLVFWSGSQRLVDAKGASMIRKEVPPTVAVIGVFVDADPTTVRETANVVGLTAAQLCGEISGDWTSLPLSLRLLRAIGFAGGSRLDATMQMVGVQDYLLDNSSSGHHGGTGESFDWRLADNVRSWGRLWLAGGLNAGNVGEAIRLVRPHAVDVSTGVETAPGIKSPELMRAFIDAVHHADHAMAREGHHAA